MEIEIGVAVFFFRWLSCCLISYHRTGVYKLLIDLWSCNVFSNWNATATSYYDISWLRCFHRARANDSLVLMQQIYRISLSF